MNKERVSVNEKSFTWNDVSISVVFGSFGSMPYYAATHSHPIHEAFIFGDCSGVMTVEGESIRLTPNSAILIPPNVKHSLSMSSAFGITLRFDYKRVDSTRANSERVFTLLDSSLASVGNCKVMSNKAFAPVCERLIGGTASDPLVASLLAKNCIEEIFILMLEEMSRSVGNKHSLYSYKTSALSNDVIISVRIEDLMHEPGCTLSSLAKELRMSTRNVQRIVKNIFGVSFSDQMARIRLEQAIKLMHDRDIPLAEIAQMAGYNRYDSFRKAFVSNYGVSPSNYRDQNINAKEKNDD